MILTRGCRVHQRMEEDCESVLETIKKEERKISITFWQNRWNRPATGKWTHRLLPNILWWIGNLQWTLRFNRTADRRRCHQPRSSTSHHGTTGGTMITADTIKNETLEWQDSADTRRDVQNAISRATDRRDRPPRSSAEHDH